MYTQDDADWWAHAQKVKETPNPDWFTPETAPGSCFPYDLIKPPQSIAEAIKANPKWRDPKFNVNTKRENVAESLKKGEVLTPSKRNNVYVPRCLTWGCRQYSVDDDALGPSSLSMKQWAQNMQESRQQQSGTGMTDNECIKALATRLLPYMQPAAEKSTSGVSVDDVLATLHPYDLQKLLSGEGQGSKDDLALSQEDIKKMTPEKTQELASRCLDWVRGQHRILEDAKSRVQNRREQASRAAAPSPKELEQAQPVGAVQLYVEKNLEFGAWTSEADLEPNAGWMNKTPSDLKIVELCQQVQALNLNIEWSATTHQGEDGQVENRYIPKLEPHFLAEQWDVLAELQDTEPYNVTLSCPGELALDQVAEPAFNPAATAINGDTGGKKPKLVDVMPLTYTEADQVKRFTVAAGVFNNVAQAASRALSVRLEAVDRPLDSKREVERLLASLVREASTVANKMIVRANALTSAVIRRDEMLRGGRDATSNPNMFGCPMTWGANFERIVGLY